MEPRTPKDLGLPEKLNMIYPLYLDKAFSREQGRKVRDGLAVEMPDVDDIRQVLSFLKIPHIVELNKNHPRDFFCLGRVKYSLARGDGLGFFNPEVTKKYDLFRKMAELIPKLKDRSVKHRSDLVDLKGIVLPSMPSAPKKPKAIKIKKK